jgi:hypothetical protein
MTAIKFGDRQMVFSCAAMTAYFLMFFYHKKNTQILTVKSS